jgi:hypothetical protein
LHIESPLGRQSEKYLTIPCEDDNRLFAGKVFNGGICLDLARQLLKLKLTTTPKPYPLAILLLWIAFFLPANSIAPEISQGKSCQRGNLADNQVILFLAML